MPIIAFRKRYARRSDRSRFAALRSSHGAPDAVGGFSGNDAVFVGRPAVDRIADETNRAVSHADVDAPGMEALRREDAPR